MFSETGTRIITETRLTSFPALSVHPRVGISRSASETDVRFYFTSVFQGLLRSTLVSVDFQNRAVLLNETVCESSFKSYL